MNNKKEVGIFYFLWTGADSSEGPYDVSKVIAKDPNAARSNEAWIAAGGGGPRTRHWWGESIFGYFKARDPYVCERDVELLTNAGIDFLAFDYSNNNSYQTELMAILAALDKYYKQGFKVPKVTFITKRLSSEHTTRIYEEVYKSHPEYSHLWYQYDGKPLIISENKPGFYTKEINDFFTMLWPQWPREGYHEDGFPWMDFHTPQQLFCQNKNKSIVSVSLAQHVGTLALSSSAFYGDNTNHTRAWHDGRNDKAKDAYMYGYNFQEQWDNALSLDADIIFVTGWNEWIATRQDVWHTPDNVNYADPIILVDNADINNSRDIQPMRGGYGDNYYIQLCRNIRKLKGDFTTNTNQDEADFTPGTYIDYVGDAARRDFDGWGDIHYTNNTGRNDFHILKVSHDSDNVRFYAETAEKIVGEGTDHWMSLFLKTGQNGVNWEGYEYVVGRKPAIARKMPLEVRTLSGWKEISQVEYTLDENKLSFSLPRSMFGESFEFKWADNYQGDDDLWSFYTDGDSAPIGRQNYKYEVKGGD